MSRRAQLSGDILYLPQGDMHWNAQGHQTLFESSKPQPEALLLSLGRKR